MPGMRRSSALKQHVAPLISYFVMRAAWGYGKQIADATGKKYPVSWFSASQWRRTEGDYELQSLFARWQKEHQRVNWKAHRAVDNYTSLNRHYVEAEYKHARIW